MGARARGCSERDPGVHARHLAGAPVELIGASGRLASTSVAVPVSNSGTHAAAVVQVGGLPAEVDVTWNDGWTCVQGAALACTLGADLPRGATENLVLTFWDTDLVVDVVAERSTVRVAAADGSTSFPLIVTSAPAAYEFAIAPPAAGPSATIDTAVQATNTGRTKGTDVRVVVDLPDGMTWSGADWADCGTAHPGALCQTIVTVPRSGSVSLPLRLVAPPGRVPSGKYPIRVTVTDAAGVTGTLTADVVVSQAPDDLSTSSSTLEPAELGADQAGVLTVDLANTGGTRADDVAVTVTLPAGTEAVDRGDLTCVAGLAGTTTCAASAVLEPGAVSQLVVGVRNVSTHALVGSVGVVIGNHGALVSDTSHEVRLLAPTVDPAVIDVTAAPETVLVRDVTAQVTFGVENTGESAAEDVAATVRLPAGVFLEGVATGSPWTCAESHGSHDTVACSLGDLAAGATADLALRVWTEGNADGRDIVATVTAAGGLSDFATTTISMGVTTCAPSWRKGEWYDEGEIASYLHRNYVRQFSFWSWLQPDRHKSLWEPLEECR